MESETRHEPENERFVVHLDGGEAILEYRHAGTKTLDYQHTFVPVRNRNQGIAERMVRYALDWARTNGYTVIPSCPFVRNLVRRHPEYRDLVVEEG